MGQWSNEGSLCAYPPKERRLVLAEALRECLEDYQNPIAAHVLESQIKLAIAEASDLDFVPEAIMSEYGQEL